MEYWFLGDETNNSAKLGEFFIVGGIVFPLDAIDAIHADIEAMRLKAGYEPGDSFKFHTRARPDQVSIETATQAKAELIECLVDRGAKMFTYVILQDIADNQSGQVRMDYALNTLSLAYYRFLGRKKSSGAFMIDREDNQHKHLATMFQSGLQMQTKVIDLSDRIRFFGMTSNNASHLSSAVDVSLGGFRYCVNHCVNGTGKSEVAKTIFGPLARLIYGVDGGGYHNIWDYGFHALPVNVKSSAHAAKYDLLRAELVALTKEPA
ncbi:hypothetical protein [Demequina lutea]|uniref:DUF3800 domain-containing protein n=1 Tax=Demequina lutea TaxID=431489 RepID=A0A7Y9ZD10_9MICO|nr:hypothetical protein [Demequina lutea]NYI41096.1 hypothetical protein [Demequina lutea]